jgi:hypothetical protein
MGPFFMDETDISVSAPDCPLKKLLYFKISGGNDGPVVFSCCVNALSWRLRALAPAFL